MDALKPNNEYTVRLVIKVICTTDKDPHKIYPELVDEIELLSIRDQNNDLLELDPDFQSTLEDQIIEELDL
jgi:hypothetical protein